MRNIVFSILVVAAMCGCYSVPKEEKGTTQLAADAGVTSADAAASADVDAGSDVSPEAQGQATCQSMGAECGVASNGSWCGGCQSGKVCSAGKCVATPVVAQDAGSTAPDTTTAPQPDVQQPKPSTTCEGRCGKFDYGVACQCDSACAKNADCCSDYAAKCVTVTPSPQCEGVEKCAISAVNNSYLWCEQFVGGNYDASGKCAVKAGTKRKLQCMGTGWKNGTAEMWAKFEQFTCLGTVVSACKTGEFCALSGGKLWCANYTGFVMDDDFKKCASTSALAEKLCGGTWESIVAVAPGEYLPASSFQCKPPAPPAPKPSTQTFKFWRKDGSFKMLFGGPSQTVSQSPWAEHKPVAGVSTIEVPAGNKFVMFLPLISEINNEKLFGYGKVDVNSAPEVVGWYGWEYGAMKGEIKQKVPLPNCETVAVGAYCAKSWSDSVHRLAVHIE